MTTTTAPPAAGALSHREILAVFVGLMTAMFLAALDQTIVATALPTIAGELGGLSQLSWVVTAYLLTSTVSVPLYGKISDLYGRKPLFQAAIVIFVAGSLVAGFAPSMGVLIGGRALQGVGAGGLLAMAQTIVGDIVAPRERGRYMGYFGAVFGLSSVIGPLLGGFFVDQLDWRWVFHINIPLGVLALVVTQRRLQMPRVRREHKVDYLGAALLTGSITALLLVLVSGGQAFAWTSTPILALGCIAVVGLVAFVAVERRSAEPLLPLDLFANRVFTVAGIMGVIVGMAMFGAIIFLPLFLQVVLGVSATSSGLLLIPLVAGLLTASITAGRLTTRWGRYKPFPVTGTAVLAVGLWLLSTMSAETSRLEVSVYMAVVGLGVGLVMQILILAAQNAVPVRHLGTATSAMQFFRSIGGALGVAVFGALLNTGLAQRIAGAGMVLPGGVRSLSSPEAIAALPVEILAVVRTSLADTITWIFALSIPLALVAFALSWLLREVPLRTTAHVGEAAPGFVEEPGAAAASALH